MDSTTIAFRFKCEVTGRVRTFSGTSYHTSEDDFAYILADAENSAYLTALDVFGPMVSCEGRV